MSRVYGRKRDRSHREIHDTLTAMGCLVIDLDGVIDMAVYEPRTQSVKLVDAKTARRDGGKDAQTDAQKRLVADGWPIDFPKSSQDAEALVRAWRK